MRWTPGGESSNIEDRRGQSGGFIPGGRMGMGIGGAVVMLVLSLIFGRDFVTGDTSTDTSLPAAANGDVSSSPAEERLVQFVSYVLDDVQNTWRGILADRHVPYQDAKLVLFRDATPSGCGVAESTMGPFYCPVDEKAYIDLGFYDELRRRFGAPGDFAQAYVLAHELGHHVQHLLGIDAQARRAQQRDPQLANAVSVRLELQADCFAGIWAHSTDQRRLLQQGDVDEALRMNGVAEQVGGKDFVGAVREIARAWTIRNGPKTVLRWARARPNFEQRTWALIGMAEALGRRRGQP